MSYYSENNNRIGSNGSISLACAVTSLIIGVLFAFLPALPDSVTIFIRPAVIVACLFFTRTKAYYKFTPSIKCLILIQFYNFFVLVGNPMTSSSVQAFATAVLYAVFFVVLQMTVWTKREIKMFLWAIIVSCSICAVLTLLENPNMFKGSAGEDITFLGVHMNTNTAAFEIVPGFLVAVYFYLFGRSRKDQYYFMKSLFLIGCAGICSFLLLGLACRSAFFAAVIGGTILLWGATSKTVNAKSRNWQRVLLVLVLILIFTAGPKLTEGSHAERLFDYDMLFDSNGRDEMNEVAEQLIRKKPFFGGGYDYWANESGEYLGVHNTFLAWGVVGGYTEMALLIGFFILSLKDLLVSKSLLPIAFFIEPLFHSLTEPGMDYFMYLPLSIAFMLVKYSVANRCRIQDAIRS